LSVSTIFRMVKKSDRLLRKRCLRRRFMGGTGTWLPLGGAAASNVQAGMISPCRQQKTAEWLCAKVGGHVVKGMESRKKLPGVVALDVQRKSRQNEGGGLGLSGFGSPLMGGRKSEP